MCTIALEEHFVTRAFVEGPGDGLRELAGRREARPEVLGGFARLPLL